MKSNLSANQITEERLAKFNRSTFSFNKDQRKFIQIVFFSWAFALAWWLIGKISFEYVPDNWDNFATRFSFVTKVMFFSSLPLLLGITTVAYQRLNPRNLIGQKLRTDTPADINKRFVANTMEQLLLFAIAQMALVVYATPEEAISFILLASLFILGRIIFWIGYHRDKFTRAIGFGLTFYPIFAAYIWLFVRIIFDYDIPI